MSEDLATVLLLTCLFLVPVFTLLAYRGWAREFRAKPSSLRTKVGLISLLAVFCSWVPLAIFLFLLLVHRSWAEFFPTYWAYGPIVLSLVGVLLAPSLKGSSRVLTLISGFFLATTLMLVYGTGDVIKR
jgi:hypothetical protein